MKHHTRLRSICMALTLAFVLTACGEKQPEPPRDAWYEQNKSLHGPLVTSEWVRSRTVLGMHLGMDLNDALAHLSNTGLEVSVSNRPVATSARPWSPRASGIGRASTTVSAEDLAVSSGVLTRRLETISLYASDVFGRSIVTGIDYSFDGDNPRIRRIGIPTDSFVGLRNGHRNHSYVYSVEKNIATSHLLEFLDYCNSEPSGGHVGGQPANCGAQQLPQMPFLYVRTEADGTTNISLRDAEMARWILKNKEAQHEYVSGR